MSGYNLAAVLAGLPDDLIKPLCCRHRRCPVGPARSDCQYPTRTITHEANIPQPDRGAPRHRRTAGRVYQTQYVRPLRQSWRGELDRRQKIVNGRPDLETVQQQLANLDATIRAMIAKYSPQTRFSTGVTVSHLTNGCNDPFTRTIGRQEASELFFGRPAPTPQQWLQIVTELAPVFKAAGFRPNNSVPGDPPQPLGARITLKSAMTASR